MVYIFFVQDKHSHQMQKGHNPYTVLCRNVTLLLTRS